MAFSVYNSTKGWAKEKGIALFAQDKVDSTNRWAKAEFEASGKQKALYLTATQTGGRGRFDRTWTSPASESSLLSTWSYKLQKPLQTPFPLRLGLALFESLQTTWPKGKFSLKAPNDIYLGSKKIAGLLIESTSSKSEQLLFIGLGLNVTEAPKGVEIAGSLKDELDLPSISTRWVEFLTLFNNKLTPLTAVQSASPLTNDEQERLLNALNRFPLLNESYNKISPEGDLYTQTQKISWQDL